MFTESEVDNEMDFIPRHVQLCRNCINFSICPYEYRCETYKRAIRWELENLDDDYSMHGAE